MFDYYTSNRISPVSKGLKNYVNFAFNYEMTECLVTYVSLHEITAMSEDFMENNSARVGDVYGCKFTARFLLIDGEWEINSLAQSKIWLVED
jgi:hypothetical protein